MWVPGPSHLDISGRALHGGLEDDRFRFLGDGGLECSGETSATVFGYDCENDRGFACGGVAKPMEVDDAESFCCDLVAQDCASGKCTVGGLSGYRSSFPCVTPTAPKARARRAHGAPPARTASAATTAPEGIIAPITVRPTSASDGVCHFAIRKEIVNLANSAAPSLRYSLSACA